MTARGFSLSLLVVVALLDDDDDDDDDASGELAGALDGTLLDGTAAEAPPFLNVADPLTRGQINLSCCCCELLQFEIRRLRSYQLWRQDLKSLLL